MESSNYTRQPFVVNHNLFGIKRKLLFRYFRTDLENLIKVRFGDKLLVYIVLSFKNNKLSN